MSIGMWENFWQDQCYDISQQKYGAYFRKSVYKWLSSWTGFHTDVYTAWYEGYAAEDSHDKDYFPDLPLVKVLVGYLLTILVC